MLIWIAMPAFETTMAILSTDVIKGTCVPWGAYSSYALEKSVTSLVFLIAFLFPLMLMVFCYARVVYTIQNKVTVRLVNGGGWEE